MTALLVLAADPLGGFIARSRLVDAGLAAFWLDIKITTGINTKDDTAAFVKAVIDGWTKHLGPTHGGSDVLAHASDSDAYG